MRHLKPMNKKARRIDELVTSMDADVVALQNGVQQRPHVPMGCALAFSPGWEVDSAGGTAGLCQPVERDIYDCYVTCFWPAQVQIGSIDRTNTRLAPNRRHLPTTLPY